MNTYEMLEELRSNIGEETASHWTQSVLVRKLSAAHRRVAMMLMLTQGDWLLKSALFTPSSGVVTLSADCAKPVYMEEVSTGNEIPITGTVRERRSTRPSVSGLAGRDLTAYFLEGSIEINDSSYSNQVRLWYQRRVWDLVGGTGDTGTTTNTIIIKTTDAPRYTDDYYVGATVEIVGGTGISTSAAVTDYDGGTRALTVSGSFSTDSVYGTVPQVPEEGHDLIILMATLSALAKPSSDIEGEIFKYYLNLEKDARAQFDSWVATRKSGSTHVRTTEID